MAGEEISEKVGGATEEVVVSAPEKVAAAPVEVRKEKERPRTAEDLFLEMEGAEGAEKP